MLDKKGAAVRTSFLLEAGENIIAGDLLTVRDGKVYRMMPGEMIWNVAETDYQSGDMVTIRHQQEVR